MKEELREDLKKKRREIQHEGETVLGGPDWTEVEWGMSRRWHEPQCVWWERHSLWKQTAWWEAYAIMPLDHNRKSITLTMPRTYKKVIIAWLLQAKRRCALWLPHFKRSTAFLSVSMQHIIKLLQREGLTVITCWTKPLGHLAASELRGMLVQRKKNALAKWTEPRPC